MRVNLKYNKMSERSMWLPYKQLEVQMICKFSDIWHLSCTQFMEKHMLLSSPLIKQSSAVAYMNVVKPASLCECKIVQTEVKV